LILVSSLFALVIYLLRLFMWAVIASWIVSLLISFGVLDTRNRLVWSVSDFLYRVTDPAIRPIRNVLPTLGGIDFSPMVLLLVIQFILIPLVIQIEVSTGVIAY
jgi:YggT family protein